MWLLHTSNLQLHSFFENIPDYVILSHMWGEDEVAFEDIGQPHAPKKAGYAKVVGCCKLAQKDGFEWAWIDTCCIDKRSSAELSEAINSMYSWYWQAAICYTFLSDVSVGSTWQSDFEASRWFKRGWTLQELLAPDVVEFYNENWMFLGTRSKLLDEIERATRIERRFLLHRDSIKDASIGTKLSWAALRKTTRTEDIAYCLLGLCRVNMPMLYGEGDRAFYRLQLEIIKRENEHSIFAWNPLNTDLRLSAMLAPSPTFFAQTSHIKPIISRRLPEASTYDVTNNGLKITLPIITVSQDRSVALLDCQDADGATVGIWLERIGDGKYQRLPDSRLVTLKKGEEEDAELLTMFLVIDNDREEIIKANRHQVSVTEVLSDRDCVVTGICLSSRDTSTLVKDIETSYNHESQLPIQYPDEAEARQRDQMRFLLQDLTLNVGQAAGFRIVYNRDHRTTKHVPIVFGLRKGRPVVNIVSEDDIFSKHWAEEIRTNSSGIWDLASDYVQLTANHVTVRVETKKMRGGLCKRSILWALAVKVFRCTCDTSDQACFCDMYRQFKHPDLFCRGLTAKQQTGLIEKAMETTCLRCMQGSELGTMYQAQLFICENCRYAAIEEMQLVEEVSGQHYLECPCYICEQESKIEGLAGSVWSPGIVSGKFLHRVNRLKQLGENAVRKKRSAEF